MNTYYKLTAELNGKRETLFGSYNKQDVAAEKREEMHNYKQDGYKYFKIEAVETEESASDDTYPEVMTANEFFVEHAPDFNFELNESELIKLAIERGFISKAGNDKYIYTTESIDGLR